MPVYFANEGAIDLDAIRVMGVSVKESNSPIGYFGTGLKFAIATLLRSSHSVELRTGGVRYVFSKRETTIRGKVFDRVHMNDEPLPFTTELGKNWVVWQAYRELHSNMLDEKGVVSDRELQDDVVFVVSGAEFQNCYQDRRSIFLETAPLEVLSGVEVHAGETNFVYYRGVRAMRLVDKLSHTYNLTKAMELTEDRTLKSLWEVEYALETTLPTTKSREFAEKLVDGGRPLAGAKFWDTSLNFNLCGSPSPEFLEVLRRHRTNFTVGSTLRTMIERVDQSEGVFPEIDPDEWEAQVLRDACEILRKLDCDLDLYEVQFVETLGPGVYGLYHVAKDQIYLARETVANGVNFCAQTLYEEWMHKRLKIRDFTREFQNHLLSKMVVLALRSPAERS